MLLKEIKVSKTNTLKHILNNLDEYIIKIDYFDQKGFKHFENNIIITFPISLNIPRKGLNIPKKCLNIPKKV